MTSSLVPEVSDLSLAVRRSIRHFRKERGWTQEDLAQLVGMDRNTLSKIENCRTGLSLKDLERIAVVLGCRVKIVLTPDE
jgi:transcriptional regulator with XRE-family HTH domain